MERIFGRSDDMIILRGVNLFPSQVEELALEQPELGPQFVLEITRPHRMDELTVKVEPRPQFTVEEAREAGLRLQRSIKVRIGSTANVQVVDHGSLPRSQGKMKRIYDLRPDAPAHGKV